MKGFTSDISAQDIANTVCGQTSAKSVTEVLQATKNLNDWLGEELERLEKVALNLRTPLGTPKDTTCATPASEGPTDLLSAIFWEIEIMQGRVNHLTKLVSHFQQAI